MKVKKATIGATAAFSSTARKARPCPPPAPMKRVSQKTCGTKTEMNPATVKPKRISFQTIFHSMKKAWAIHRQPSRENRSEEHTSELQSLMRISYAVFCLKKKKQHLTNITNDHTHKSKNIDTKTQQ